MRNEVNRTLVAMKTYTTMQNRKKMQNSNNMSANNLSGWKGLGGMYAMRYVCAMVVMLFGHGVGNAWG